MKLFVGLGNPGEKYAKNRHNVGAMVLQRIADHHGLGSWRKRFGGIASDGTIDGEKVILLRPLTYYNESGQSVGEAVRFLKIDLSDVIVFHDEIDLAPGKVRVKIGGGNAGNNGLRSITSHLGTDFIRVRIGVGHPGSKDAVAHYVLHDFPKAEQDGLDAMMDAMARAAPKLAEGEHNRFQTDVAQAINDFQQKDGPNRSDIHPGEPKTRAKTKPKTRHPAGERQNKRQSALAENLKRWLAGRNSDQPD